MRQPSTAEPSLIAMRSNYSGRCKTPKCKGKWEPRESFYWEPVTRNGYCLACGHKRMVEEGWEDE